MKSVQTLVFILSLSIAGVASASQEFFPFVGAATTDGVNIRAGQSTNYEKMGQLTKGEEVIVVADKYSWYKIRLPKSAPNYISAEYVGGAGKITGSKVNVRARPNINATTLYQVIKGDQVQVLETKDGWSRIVPGDKAYGWVAKNLLTFKSKDLTSFKAPKAADAPPAEKPAAVSQPPAPTAAVAPASPTTFKGTLQPISESTETNLQYQLVVAPDKHYGIKGFSGHMLEAFEYYTVAVEGVLQKDASAQLPVLEASKVQLIL